MSALFWFPLDRARGTVIGFGAVNPSTYQVDVGGTMTTVGIDKPAGSLFVQVADNGSSATLWLKSGSAATAWTTIAVGAMTQAQGDARYAQLAGATFTGQVNIGGIALTTDSNGGLELGPSTSTGKTPHLDFHFGVGSAQDYNVRVINDADGRLSVQFATGAKLFSIGGGISVTLPTSGGNTIAMNGAGSNYQAWWNGSTRRSYLGFPASGSSNMEWKNEEGGPLALKTTGGSATLDASGNWTASGGVAASSDRRLKTRVRRITGALDLVKRLRGVRYTWRATGRAGVGVIAQEVQAVLPELVHVADDARGTLAVEDARLTAVLIEAVKEQQRQIDRLTTRLATLEATR